MTAPAVLAEQIKNLKEDLAELREEFRTTRNEQGRKIDSLNLFRVWLVGVAVPVSFVVGLFSDEMKEALKHVIQ